LHYRQFPFAAFSEIPAIFVGKKTAAKQMEGGFFQPVAFVLSVIINSLPTSLVSTFIFATIMYWMVGYADDVGRFFFSRLLLSFTSLLCPRFFGCILLHFPPRNLLKLPQA